MMIQRVIVIVITRRRRDLSGMCHLYTSPISRNIILLRPESLHRDFMRAIFSVGLRFCTAKKAQALLGGKYDVDSIESCLHNFRNFNEAVLKMHESNARQKKNRAMTGLDDLNAELLALNKSITTQVMLLEKFKASLTKLMQVRDDLARRVELATNPKPGGNMEPPPDLFMDIPADFALPSFDFSAAIKEVTGPPPIPPRASYPLGGNGRLPPDGIQLSRPRPELSMLSAMRQHMNMHRELLDFNSKYTTPSPMSAPGGPLSITRPPQSMTLHPPDNGGRLAASIPPAPLVPASSVTGGGMGPPGRGIDMAHSVVNSMPTTVGVPNMDDGKLNSVFHDNGRPDVGYIPQLPLQAREFPYDVTGGSKMQEAQGLTSVGDGGIGDDFDLFDFLF